ncbi:hypothetical protein ACSBR2_037547 [Camellia fascicularis]
MASNGQQEKIGDDAHAGSGRPIDLDTEGDNHSAETVTRVRERKTSARSTTHQRNQTKTGIITKITSKYGKTDAYGGMKK